MKETGIIMSGNHPKLILEGRKTMTRRTRGLEKINKDPVKRAKMRSKSYLATGWRGL